MGIFFEKNECNSVVNTFERVGGSKPQSRIRDFKNDGEEIQKPKS